MTAKLFETALGISAPWYVAGTDFNAQLRTLTIRVDFVRGRRLVVPDVDGELPVHDTVSKRYRHLNFFQHECFLEVREAEPVSMPWAAPAMGTCEAQP